MLHKETVQPSTLGLLEKLMKNTVFKFTQTNKMYEAVSWAMIWKL